MTGAVARGFAPAWQTGQKPREARRQVFLRARMRAGGTSVDICIRNISSRGMLLQAAVPPACGSYVEICFPNHTIVARVVWTHERRFGVYTRETMDVSAIAGEAAPGSSSSNRTSRSASLAPKPDAPSPAAVMESFERSRRISAAFEFGSLILCSAGAVLIAAGVIYGHLTATFENVSTHL